MVKLLVVGGLWLAGGLLHFGAVAMMQMPAFQLSVSIGVAFARFDVPFHNASEHHGPSRSEGGFRSCFWVIIGSLVGWRSRGEFWNISYSPVIGGFAVCSSVGLGYRSRLLGINPNRMSKAEQFPLLCPLYPGSPTVATTGAPHSLVLPSYPLCVFNYCYVYHKIPALSRSPKLK